MPDLSLAFITAIWGTTFVVNELVLKDAPPLMFLAVRFALAAAVLLAFARGTRHTPGLVRDSLIIGSLLAVSIGCQLAGQVYTTASKTAFITGLSVPLTPIIAYLVARKLPSRANFQGLVLAVAGFVVLAWPKDATRLEPGDALVFLTAVIYGYIIFYMGEVASRHNARRFAAGQISGAAICFLIGRFVIWPFLPKSGAFAAMEARPLPPTTGFWISVLWMALIATVLTFIVQTWAQARMPANHAALIFSMEPVWTALFAAMMLGERMTNREIAGGALILVGILAAERREC
jgi:drug/metabolite transporter (DMT)-like permease